MWPEVVKYTVIAHLKMLATACMLLIVYSVVLSSALCLQWFRLLHVVTFHLTGMILDLIFVFVYCNKTTYIDIDGSLYW